MMMGGQHGVIQGQPGMIGSQPVMMPGQPGMMQPQTMGMMGQMGMPNMGMQVGPMGMGVQPMGMQTQMGGMVQMGGMGQVMTHPMGHMAPGKIFKVFMMGFKKVWDKQHTNYQGWYHNSTKWWVLNNHQYPCQLHLQFQVVNNQEPVHQVLKGKHWVKVNLYWNIFFAQEVPRLIGPYHRLLEQDMDNNFKLQIELKQDSLQEFRL